MSPAFQKLLCILGAVLITAAITWFPWTYFDHFTGAASSVYGMSSIIWAPTAALIGLGTGAFLAYSLWPRKRKQ